MSSLDDIRKQEEDIFEELGSYDFSELPKFAKDSPKDKALKQLAVSDDSPFSTHGQELSKADLVRLKEERAALLREETEEIKRQLEIVKRRLNELKPSQATRSNDRDNDDVVIISGKAPNEFQEKIEKKSSEKQVVPVTTIENSAHQNQRQQSLVASIEAETAPKIQQQPQQQPMKHQRQKFSEPKFRPLTGKADCPNCTCDRRTSVCDQCTSLALVVTAKQLHPRPSSKRAQDLASSLSASYVPLKNDNDPRPSERRHLTNQFIENPDDRPIRPAKEKVLATVESVDDKVVPGKVYTISKSLNEKRTKLAQAIDDLQHMMDQVREKGNKLEEQRKVAQLYKDQWKFGPTIGGPVASPRQRLGATNQRRNYESRLDANLNRDLKSLMGFKHIESTMKLRHYGSTSNVAASTASSRMKAKQSVHHLRSKSLESLARSGGRTKTAAITSNRPAQVAGSRFYDCKSFSEIDLSSTTAVKSQAIHRDRVDESKKDNGRDGDNNNGEDDDEDDSVEKFNVENIADIDPDQGLVEQSKATPPAMANHASYQPPEDGGVQPNQTSVVQKMTWIPVFGETEIKTIKRAPTKRKVQIVQANEINTNIRSQTQQSSDTRRVTIGRQRILSQSQQQSYSQKRPRSGYTSQQSNLRTRTFPKEISSNTTTDPVMVDAKRKLKFATDLLEQEHRDSANRNQLIINRTIAPAVPKPRNREGSSMPTAGTTMTRTSSASCDQQSAAASSNVGSSSEQVTIRETDMQTLKEISRLEEMLNEQQKLLSKLTHSQERQRLVSPVTVRCASPCCHHTNTSSGCAGRIVAGGGCQHLRYPGVGGVTTAVGLPSPNKLLVNNLRDRLNKTKMRLARTLEEEREKHQQLKKKVDSSLRKQSDLENENELLKQSLSKCIDTCLKDISNTFESLSDTLADSINGVTNQQDRAQARDGERGGSASDKISRPMSDNDSSQAVLSNAAQLITDNRLLKQMKGHIVAIEQQRKGIFEELSKEKQRSNQLEMKLRQSQAELNRLMEAERKLGSQAALEGSKQQRQLLDQPISDHHSHQQQLSGDQRGQETEQGRLAASTAGAEDVSKIKLTDKDSPQPSTSSHQQHQLQATSTSTTTTTSNNQVQSSQIDSELDDSYNSIDVYGRFLQRMTPDIESIRRERKHLFDNLKSILANIDGT